MEIDEVDLRILQVLTDNSRAPLKMLAQVTGTSIPTVRNRIQRMRGAGLVKFTTSIDEHKLGRVFTAYVTAKVKISSLQALREKIRAMEEVTEAYVTMGESDVIIRVSFENSEELERFLVERLSKLEGIDTVRSSFVVEELKDRFTEFPRPGIGIKISCPNCHQRIGSNYVKTKVNNYDRYFCSGACVSQYSASHPLSK